MISPLQNEARTRSNRFELSTLICQILLITSMLCPVPARSTAYGGVQVTSRLRRMLARGCRNAEHPRPGDAHAEASTKYALTLASLQDTIVLNVALSFQP
jgi:hypothetical protein